MSSQANGLYPIPLWQFVIILHDEDAVSWGERGMSWIVDKLNSRKDEVLFHLSASNSSLTNYVRAKRISLDCKTAHCDVQHSIWKLNLDAGNDKCPIDSLWAESKYRFFRDGSRKGTKTIHAPSFDSAILYAKELSMRPYRRTGRGVICPAKDGCFCRSLDEVRVDDWLYENGFSHEKEPSYPMHPVYNKLGRKRADWKVNGVLIEYAGLVSSSYKSNLAEKLQLAKERGIEVVVLTSRDLPHLERVLLPRLRG